MMTRGGLGQGGLTGRDDAAHDSMSFGAVYEYVDSAGKARLVGSTAGQPEKKYAIDREDHSSVSTLLKQDRAAPKLVWAGIGRRSRGCGEGEMSVIRNDVAEDRAARLHADKLGSIKPYSRHS